MNLRTIFNEQNFDRLNGVLWAAVFLALAGCSGETFEQPYKKPPQLNSVVVTVVWVDGADIRAKCHNANAYACATVATPEMPFSTIYAIKPRSFTQAPLVEALGHELLHSLGATHE